MLMPGPVFEPRAPRKRTGLRHHFSFTREELGRLFKELVVDQIKDFFMEKIIFPIVGGGLKAVWTIIMVCLFGYATKEAAVIVYKGTMAQPTVAAPQPVYVPPTPSPDALTRGAMQHQRDEVAIREWQARETEMYRMQRQHEEAARIRQQPFETARMNQQQRWQEDARRSLQQPHYTPPAASGPSSYTTPSFNAPNYNTQPAYTPPTFNRPTYTPPAYTPPTHQQPTLPQRR
jgi:hypothetical protein